MPWPVCLDNPVLFLDAASVDHELRLSGPSPAPPGAGHTAGTDVWEGPYGTPVDEWTDITHPPITVGVSYPLTAAGLPNPSWLLDTQFPDGWYTVRKRIA